MAYVAKTRKEIRQLIGDICGTVIIGACSSAGSTTTVIDDQNLHGGADDYKGQEILMTSGANDGEKSRVIDFNPNSKKLTLSPAFTNATADGDEYELHSKFNVTRLNNAVNLAIIGVADDVFVTKVDDSTLGTLINEYEYTIPTDFVALHTVEYASAIKVDHLLDDCEAAWTAGASVTATADASFKKIGSSSCKLVVAAGAAAGALLGYKNISSVDVSDCDKIEFWMYSSIALPSGYASFVLDDTLACASALDTMTIPAMSANTWYKHSIALSNPYLDTAIVSIGIKQYTAVDFGACTIYLDDVHAVLAKSRMYKELNPESWFIVKGTSPQLKLSGAAISEIGNNKRLRLSGYKLLSELSTDSSEAEVDPDYIVARAAADLLSKDPDEKERVKYYMSLAEAKKHDARTSFSMNTRWTG